jgi:hypothetical protein
MRLTALALASLTACAARVPAPVPASQPSSMVKMTRDRFDALAAAVVEQNLARNLAIVGCGEALKEAQDAEKKQKAIADKEKTTATLWSIFGPIGAAVLSATAVLVTHYVSAPPTK